MLNTKNRETCKDIISNTLHEYGLEKLDTNEIMSKLTEKQRFYHTEKHIADMLLILKHIKQNKIIEGVDYKKIALMIIYHDIIYDTQSVIKGENEELSAKYAVDKLVNTGLFDTKYIDDIKNGILATIQHKSSDPEIQLLLDIDLSILSSDEYLEYTENIRKEYSHIPDEYYIPRRIEIMSKFLEKAKQMKNFYHYPYFQKNEYKIIENMETEIESLKNKINTISNTI